MKKTLFIIACLLLAITLVSCNVNPALCQHRDADDDFFCDKCGESYTDGKDLPDEHVCTFDQKNAAEKYLVKTADCENAAIYKYSCSCGEAGNEAFVDGAALGHDEQSHSAKAPTCTEPGYDEYVTCSRCDYTTYRANPATGHKYDDGSCKCKNCAFYNHFSDDGDCTCDVCETPLDHSDMNSDCKCDYCGAPAGEHTDADGDFICDDCGSEIGIEDGDSDGSAGGGILLPEVPIV